MQNEETQQNWFTSLSDFLGGELGWVYEVFIIVFLTLVIALVVNWFVTKIEKKAIKTTNLWDDALVNSVKKPIKWLIWLAGLSWAASIAGEHSSSEILNAVGKIQHLGSIFLVSWFLTGFIRRAEENLISPDKMSKPMDKTTAVAIGKLLRISVMITSVLVAVQSLGYSVSGVLAFGGIGGIAVGFAAKDLLANFFGGLMIYLDRPFSVGDWVRSPDKNIEGTVEEIGWRLTRIRTFDKRPLYVPNSTFTQISVENPSRMLNRRIYETIGVRYDDANKITEIVTNVKNMLLEHSDIDVSQTLIVNLNSFAPSSLDFFVYCFTKTTDWIEFHRIKQDVMLRIIEIIESHGAECAFPTSTVHIPQEISLNKSE